MNVGGGRTGWTAFDNVYDLCASRAEKGGPEILLLIPFSPLYFFSFLAVCDRRRLDAVRDAVFFTSSKRTAGHAISEHERGRNG
ncbi:PII uridylyl-transferase [Anopheles sinensis]|uniref:PII uridylyl-transferase n=1 Tax=Anopheles sinensis TaxID=74873 RepID=A0A084WK09_ANOSI|nr:PII uridylyl-transferase [Anopheles sinensis]